MHTYSFLVTKKPRPVWGAMVKDLLQDEFPAAQVLAVSMACFADPWVVLVHTGAPLDEATRSAIQQMLDALDADEYALPYQRPSYQRIDM